MLYLHDDDFYDYIATTAKPIRIYVTDKTDYVIDAVYMKKLNNAINKNIYSTELRFISRNIYDDVNFSQFITKLKVSTTIKTLELPEFNGGTVGQFLLPQGIANLTLGQFNDINRVDFSQNNSLQYMEIRYRIANQLIEDMKNENELSHLYNLQQICFKKICFKRHWDGVTAIDSDEFEKIKTAVKSPYGCAITFQNVEL